MGFGLTAIGIGIDHGWISRTQGLARVVTTLKTFLNRPQGPAASGTIGYKGWFYHFLDMNTALRSGSRAFLDRHGVVAGGSSVRRSNTSTAPTHQETAIRAMADAIFNRIDWNWMARGTNVLSMGWYPDSGFIAEQLDRL